VNRRRSVISLVVVAFVLLGANFLFTAHYVNSTRAALLHQEQQYEAGQRQEQAQQRAAGALVIAKLCTTFGELAANKPPAGNPNTNPSRAYDQRNHEILDGVGPDIGCGGFH
jgi:type II secretory pathway pseudopilin PulG